MGEQKNKSQKTRTSLGIYRKQPLSPSSNSKTLAMTRRLSTETVEGSALSLQSVDDIEGGNSLPLGVFGVGDRVSDDVLEEDL
jgi:hypothetical protein